MMDRSRRLLPAVLAGALLGCGAPAAPRATETAASVPAAPAALDPARYHVLMLSGGGGPSINYSSHLVHLARLRELLVASGVSPAQISVLSSDGADPAPDLAQRDAPPEADFWLLQSTRVGQRLDTPMELVSSTIPGVTLAPATKSSVGRWFDAEGRRLRAGDVLLLYVTDHGTRQSNDPLDNRITLWGKDAGLSVRELSAALGALDPQVRVVTLMSQCFSGGFGRVAWSRAQDGEPAGNVCGYFSSTADRPAYGCFAENRGKDAVGHSFHFTQALAESGRLALAHAAVLTTDRSPDVPLRTSDLYLEEMLVKAAAVAGTSLPAFADELLRAALRDPAAWEPEIRLLDRVAHAFGCYGPRSLADLAEQAAKLPQLSDQLDTFQKAWDTALGDAEAANLDRFVEARPAWLARLGDPALAGLDLGAKSRVRGELLADLGPFTRADAGVSDRLEQLHRRSASTEELSYRLEVRLGALLRMRSVLLDIAGKSWLAAHGTPAQQRAHAALLACEDLALPRALRPPAPRVVEAEPYPSLDKDLDLAHRILPGWMGVTFQGLTPEQRQKKHLAEGASMVTAVFPDSPAKSAGFTVGDIVLGPPGQPFTARNQLRAFTMLSAIDAPAPLDVIRAEDRLTLTLVPKPFPMKWPELPGPAAVGAVAPAVEVTPYRGAVKQSLAKGSAHLLYFWATWCGPCKAALPEVLAFEKERKIPVVAITDEPSEQLDAFFKKYPGSFPRAVAVDELRRSFAAHGVSGTPTFVLVDDKGVVRGYQTGYLAAQGLELPSWSWAGRSAVGKR
jgi:thiol-disulfide isomerase/thioredoxin